MTRIAIVKKEKCKPNLCGWQCMKSCPVNMKGADCIYEDKTDKKAGIDEILCTGCGICPKICPFDALTIINLPDTKGLEALHQYGLNGFRIFHLPLIQESAITGIVGRNGIGKSTVINVLSKTIRANFGKFDLSSISDEEYFSRLIQLFKGTALQNYFTKLSREEIRIAYKPQQIVSIPHVFKGTVNELLTRVCDDEERKKSMAEKLHVAHILDRDIAVLSGGELQRVALCSCLLKKDATLYIFDEVTNYLDIYERLNSASVIKEVVASNTALVVEHDLIVMDFLLDFLHIMYGQEGAYGMLTGVKSAKAGINDYLGGYSKEENVRFRDKAISFDKDSVSEDKRIDVFVSWGERKIEAGNFSVTVQDGDVKKGEIVGIIGRNALGKSLFLKSVAHAEGEFGMLAISYKEQLIERSDTLVLSELSQFPNYTDTFYQMYVLDPLNIAPLLEREISDLSGGELQRFAIARCLLQDAQIYVLDEPTAFLDIEDRLKVSKVLRNFVTLKGRSAFIVDHDLVFMDYLSDKLMVFEGKPGLEGFGLSPMSMRDGMNHFLKQLKITFRRDDGNKRPRINKLGSVKDQEQKKSGEYYYA
ncbi:ribosome biogenesis/translation initiation ATPase RLI [Candidatus Woesearchaeota archaeon]|nr:ribosome biogenesis/translation initiation ATPase RLI [Nanoarchaeota archaeon]MCB9370305.1 ribosome biogenesis/translation initiation ATPase RLI [Candidatus Woesearchaeota archaeon]USN44829.1 MAG: ribosome biogenesis/translation initiation ATPase RLI [Candidatus Woesearchaeota archaeon]